MRRSNRPRDKDIEEEKQVKGKSEEYDNKKEVSKDKEANMKEQSENEIEKKEAKENEKEKENSDDKEKNEANADISSVDLLCTNLEEIVNEFRTFADNIDNLKATIQQVTPLAQNLYQMQTQNNNKKKDKQTKNNVGNTYPNESISNNLEELQPLLSMLSQAKSNDNNQQSMQTQAEKPDLQSMLSQMNNSSDNLQGMVDQFKGMDKSSLNNFLMQMLTQNFPND
jgi:hypothetical protein